MTTRLMMVGDAGAHTGFEKVLRYVATHLSNTGKYDITIRGIGYEEGNDKIQYPAPVKPMLGTPDDPVGILQFHKHIEEDKPDVVWIVQDLWNILGTTLQKPIDLPMVGYFPVDTPNVSLGNAWGVGALTEAVCYTDFGAKETAAGLRMAVDVLAKRKPDVADTPREWIQSSRLNYPFYGRMDRYARYQNPRNFNIVPHGLDAGVFEPRDRAACRKQFNLPESAFLVGYVATNQFRKRQDLALRAFAKHLQHYADSYLVLHCTRDFGQAWDLEQLCYLWGIREKVILTHRTVGELSENDLCSLYNAFDVCINTSGGEGWGLPIFESALCGVPQLVPDWSATRELWKEHGMLIKVEDYRIEPRMGINTAHAVIDTDNLAAWLTVLAKDPQLRQAWADKALALAKDQPSWAVIGDAFDQIIQNSLHEPAPREYSLTQLQKLRDGQVECEVAQWL